VQLTTTCPRKHRLSFTEWLPLGAPAIGLDRLAQGDFAVRFSQPISVTALPGSYASAREPALQAYRVQVECSGAPVRVRWTGDEPAPG
jgi:hypothetical protein